MLKKRRLRLREVVRGFSRRIAVIELAPLCGTLQGWGQDPGELLQSIGNRAVLEAQRLEKAGFDAVCIENTHDGPFSLERITVAQTGCLTLIAAAVRESVNIPVGLHVLAHDARSSLEIATITELDFIRVRVLGGIAATPEGLVTGEAGLLHRERERLRSKVQILADITAGVTLGQTHDDLEIAMEQLTRQMLADALLLGGLLPRWSAPRALMQRARNKAHSLQIPLYVDGGRLALSKLESMQDCFGGGMGFFAQGGIRRRQMAPAQLISPTQLRLWSQQLGAWFA